MIEKVEGAVITAEITEEYWNESASSYSKSIQGELDSEQSLWLDLIMENAPDVPCMRALDIGCGPGFFTILLAKAGHKVTGVDCTPNMLEEASANAKAQGVEVELRQMNAHAIDYPDNTFDLIVSRNVTWTLYEPEAAYKEWKRVLKPGGRLLIFDAAWYMQTFVQEDYDFMKKGIRKYREKYGDLPPRFSMHYRDDYWSKLPMIGRARPLWDRAELWKLAFDDIVSEDISERADRGDIDINLYRCCPMFLVRGTKLDPVEEKKWERRVYWNGYAPREGIRSIKLIQDQGQTAIAQILAELKVEKGARILDAGCGAGANTLLLTKEGYDVVGVDFATEIIEEAHYTEEVTGLKGQFVCADLAKLPFETDSFDCVLFSNMEGECPDEEAVMAELDRVLKPGGQFLSV